MSVLGKWTLIFISAGLAGWAASFAQPARKPGTIVEAESCRFEVGTNVDGLAYWSSAFPLFDLSKQAGHWLVQRPGEWDTGEELRLDEGGWPLAIPAGHNLGLILTRESQPPLPQANYQMRLDTNARVRGMLGTQVETAGADAYRLRSAADGSVHLAFEAGDLPLRMKGLSVVRSEHAVAVAKGEQFDPRWTRHLAPFSTIRFMDWGDTNNLSSADGTKVRWTEGVGFDVQKRPLAWANRPKMTDVRWHRGVPVEAMVQLANETGADPWFNMPINATDDYIRGFAIYVRDHLKPAATIRVELSNEVWNGIFPQSAYASARAKEEWGKSADGLEYYGRRTAEMGIIWNEVFGEPATGGRPGRVRIVYGTHFVWKGRETAGLETERWIDAQGNRRRAADYFDDYAVTGYYDGDFGSEERRSDIRRWLAAGDQGQVEAIAALRRRIDEHVAPLYVYHAGRARDFGLSLLTYESGYGEAPPPALRDDKAYVDFLVTLQRRPEIEELEVRNALAFRSAGGCVFTNFGIVAAPGRYGSWAALEHQGQTTSPRYRALVRLSARAAAERQARQ